MAVVLVMAVLSLSFVNAFLAQRSDRARENERLEQYAEGLATVCARAFRGARAYDRNTLQNQLQEQLASQLGLLTLQVYRLDETGPQQLAVAGDFEEFEKPFVTPSRTTTQRLDRRGVIIIDAPLPLRDAGEDVPVLRIIATPSASAVKTGVRDTIIVAGGVAIVLLLFGGALIELQVSRPLRAVREGAARVAEGELNVEVPTDGPAEFAELAVDFNRMTHSLRAQLQTVADQRDQLQSSERLAAIGKLAAGVAHEVGNPLAAIHGYTEFLLDPRSELGESERELLSRIQTQTERIQGIVSQLLDYSRQRKVELAATKLRGIVDEVADLLRADPRWREAEIETTGSNETTAEVDRDLLVQVVLNLGINGLEAASASEAPVPRIQLRVSPASTSAPWIEVQDNGPGVPDDVRPRLFEPFFTTRAAGEGTGLGLAISQGLVERMHGELACLDVDSRRPLTDDDAPGATFRVTLASPEA